MSANTSIEWCDHTFNPWVGCTKVSPGCDHCYAEGWAKRAGKAGGVIWGGERRRTSEANWRQPMRWNAIAAAGHFVECSGCGRRGDARTWEDDIRRKHPQAITCCPDRKLVATRPRVFCASLADVFDNQVQAQWREDLFELIRMTPHLDWLLLTKRIGNAARMLPEKFGPATYPNAWIGVTVVNQEGADRDIPKLLAVPAARRFLSIEPMLGPIDLEKAKALRSLCGTCKAGKSNSCFLSQPGPFVDWVICGGESGPHARPMHPDWPRSLRDQCAAAGVPFLFKQWGEWAQADPIPGVKFGDELRRGTVQHLHAAGNPEGYFRRGDAYVRRVGKKAAGRLLDGREHTNFPGCGIVN